MTGCKCQGGDTKCDEMKASRRQPYVGRSGKRKKKKSLLYWNVENTCRIIFMQDEITCHIILMQDAFMRVRCVAVASCMMLSCISDARVAGRVVFFICTWVLYGAITV